MNLSLRERLRRRRATPERIHPERIPALTDDACWEWWEEHVHVWRYCYVAWQSNLGRVADAACGLGYGTAILAGRGHDVVGFDRDFGAIRRARDRYPASQFEILDLNVLSKPILVGFQTLVTFETLEHLTDPRGTIRQLAPSITRLFASVPIIPTVGINPHHLHDFDINSFGLMLDTAGWKIVDTQLQSAPFRRHVYAVVEACR